MIHSLNVGPLHFSLHRTVRVANTNDPAYLPPSLGNFEICKVEDYKCPESWDKDAYFIAMHSQEAMWISFQTFTPVAVMVGAGKINALDGKTFGEKLEKDGYLVCPPQPWLDGWKADDGSVYQFVATEVGEGRTIGEQLAETQDHAILISVFEAKNPEKFVRAHGCCRGITQDSFGLECCAAAPQSAGLCNEMGMGKGGKITQKIYDDPHGIEEWKECATKTVKIYLINASEFSEITGTPLPPPVSEEEYNGIWFGMEDGHMNDIKGTQVFDELKSAIKEPL